MYQFSPKFMQQVVETMPTEGGFDRDYILKVEEAWFQTDPEYGKHAKDGVAPAQLCLHGPKLDDNGNIIDGPFRTEKWSCGAGWKLTNIIPSNEAEEKKGIKKGLGIVCMEKDAEGKPKYVKLSGSSLAGGMLKDLLTKWQHTPETQDTIIYEIGDDVVNLSPTGYRYLRWLDMNGKGPTWLKSDIWVGVCLQMGAQTFRLSSMKQSEPDKERTVAVDLFALVGEVPEGEEGEQAEHPEVAEESAEEVEEVEEAPAPPPKKAEVKKAAAAEPAKKTAVPATKPNATATPAATPANGTATPTGKVELKGDDIEAFKRGKLTELATAASDHVEWRSAVVLLPEVKGTPKLMMFALASEKAWTELMMAAAEA